MKKPFRSLWQECSELWRLLFSELKQRNTQAIGDLVDLSIAYYFKPPGQPVDRLAYMRSLFIWSVYSLNSNGKSRSNFANDLLQNDEVIRQTEASIFVACLQKLDSQITIESCRAAAVKNHTIPEYKDFIGQFVFEARASGSSSCLLSRRDGDNLKEF
jgi:hypothetical protein